MFYNPDGLNKIQNKSGAVGQAYNRMGQCVRPSCKGIFIIDGKNLLRKQIDKKELPQIKPLGIAFVY